MKRMLGMLGLLALPVVAQTVNAVEHLQRTQKMFLEETAGLSEAQWKFKAGPDRWSIAECAEHITASEELLYGLVVKVSKGPIAAEGSKVPDAKVVAGVTDRSFKAQAPEALRPTARWANREEVAKEFQARRARTLALAAPPAEAELRKRVAPSQIFGTLDAYQYILFLSGHTERHVMQIREVKASPDFPKQ